MTEDEDITRPPAHLQMNYEIGDTPIVSQVCTRHAPDRLHHWYVVAVEVVMCRIGLVSLEGKIFSRCPFRFRVDLLGATPHCISAIHR